MSVKLLSEHHLEFLGLKGGCTGSSVSTLVEMPYCWKTHVTAHNELMKYSLFAGGFSEVGHGAYTILVALVHNYMI